MAAKMFFMVLALAVLTAFVMAEDDDFEGFEDDTLFEIMKRGRKGKAAFHRKYLPTIRGWGLGMYCQANVTFQPFPVYPSLILSTVL